jgi:hypothetical protein
VGEVVEKLESKMVQACDEKSVGGSARKIKVELTNGPATPLMSIY